MLLCTNAVVFLTAHFILHQFSRSFSASPYFTPSFSWSLTLLIHFCRSQSQAHLSIVYGFCLLPFLGKIGMCLSPIQQYFFHSWTFKGHLLEVNNHYSSFSALGSSCVCLWLELIKSLGAPSLVSSPLFNLFAPSLPIQMSVFLTGEKEAK